MNRRSLLGVLVAAVASVFLPKSAGAKQKPYDAAAARKNLQLHSPFDYTDEQGRYHARWCYRLEPNGTLSYIFWTYQKRGDIIMCHDTVDTTIVSMHAHQCLSDPDKTKPNAPVTIHTLCVGFVQVLAHKRAHPPGRECEFANIAHWHLRDI
jgi:hypothetical protein